MSFESIHILNMFLGSGAILLQILSVAALVLLVAGAKENKYLSFIHKNYVLLGFVVSLSATFFTLVYSEIVGFLPCYLCWYQRIFTIPMMFIFGAAHFSKDRNILKYVLPMLLVGLAISIYQNFIYYFGGDSSTLPCDASGVSCYQRLVSEFGGYISIPMLALTTFVALITIVLVAHFYKKQD